MGVHTIFAISQKRALLIVVDSDPDRFGTFLPGPIQIRNNLLWIAGSDSDRKLAHSQLT
jgi:hypothetical protein